MIERKPPVGGPRQQLSLGDATAIILGIVIGAGIYETSPLIAQGAGGVGGLLAIWVAGGLIALVGSLCYAELATAFPREGGEYVYLREAFGRRASFLYAWAQLTVIRPGSLGAMAFVFARYADQLWPLTAGPASLTLYAAASVTLLSGLNLLGVREEKLTQNGLTLVKVAGLLAIFAVGVFGPVAGDTNTVAVSPTDGDWADFRLAMILVLFTYGGWNDMPLVAAEVRRPHKNLARALVLGTVGVTAVYLLVNLAFVRVLGLEGLRQSGAVAVEAVEPLLGPAGKRVVGSLICISCLGAVHGMLFTGARLYYAAGTEHALFRWVGTWDPGRGVPVRSLVIQWAVTLAAVLLCGLAGGEAAFRRLVDFSAPVFWLFILAVAIGLLRLRRRQPGLARPFRVPAYPLTPLLFYAACLFMVVSSINWAVINLSAEAAWGGALLGAGVLLSLVDRPRGAGRIET